MAQFSTAVLHLIQFLGYFPIRLKPQQSERNHKHSKKWNITSRLFSSTFFCILPSLFYSLLGISVIFIFILDFTNIKSTISPKNLATRGTFYSALILKSASHLFCSVFIKLDMIYRRKKYQKFFNNFKLLLASGQTFLENYQVVGCKRFERRFHKETLAFVFLVSLLSMEMIFSQLYGMFSISYVSVTLFPAILGYFHSIFTVLLVFFLNWYLEILKRINVVIRNRAGCCKTLSRDFGSRHLSRSWRCSGRGKKLRPICDSKSVTKDSQVLADLYNRVRDQAEEFNKLFGLWLAIDMGHSLLRIVVSLYFNSNLMSRKVYHLRSILQNFLTVLLYFYLLYAVCKKGSDIVDESKSIVEGMESLTRGENGDKVIDSNRQKCFK